MNGNLTEKNILLTAASQHSWFKETS